MASTGAANVRRWWRKMGLSVKLGVCFVVYVTVGFPAVLIGGSAILSAAGIPPNTSAAQSPVVAAFFILLAGPVFVLPIAALVVGIRGWLKNRRIPKPAS
ncbi:MAG: hypothetical protein OK452_08970 [Thaumarchaeota archaeon]|nr:hypothetical protein [Nitrososphaerota archaeon]